MLRDTSANLRVEELPVPGSFVGRPVSSLDLKRFPHVLLLAIRTKGGWVYNPPESHIIEQKNTLVFMTTPEDRDALAESLRDECVNEGSQ
jgi:voltage-gated potassium channel